MKNEVRTERASLRCAPIATQITEGLHPARFVQMRAVLSATYSYIKGDKTHDIFPVHRGPDQTEVVINFPPGQGRLARLEHFIFDHTLGDHPAKLHYDSFDMANFIVARLITKNRGFTVEEPHHMKPGEAYYIECEGDPHHSIAVLGTNEPDQALTIPSPATGSLAVIGVEQLLSVFPGGELRRPIFDDNGSRDAQH